MSEDVTVKIWTRGTQTTYLVRKGLGFQALCARHKEAPLEFDCREADCGICLIRVREGLENLGPHTKSEGDFLKAMRAEPNERLACQTRILGDCEVEVEDA